MRQRLVGITLCLGFGMALAAAPALAAGDAAAGKKVFNRCRVCHTVDAAAKNGIGPHLHGVFGRKSGTADGFRYSAAMKKAGVVWNEKTLATYLADPKAFVPGNRMAFAGLRKPQDIADLIAYLKQATQ